MYEIDLRKFPRVASMTTSDRSLSLEDRAMKRLMDVITAGTLLLFLGPLLLAAPAMGMTMAVDVFPSAQNRPSQPVLLYSEIFGR